ncbi:hypothetical protein EPI10_000864 [Gossypium australe]|uniref:Uncharacterized protein n=1 Tax=Gossypium australe TaxID=47621 RepID=A0A5B6V9K4_9ROSI|nr:hypothetical protein EPI10_000864 [Gossypium australe]
MPQKLKNDSGILSLNTAEICCWSSVRSSVCCITIDSAFKIDLHLLRRRCSVHRKRTFDPNLLKKKLNDKELAKELYKKYSAVYSRCSCWTCQ